jgi:acetyl-CoA decarbonylase/synthase complex subunit epsilon
MAAEPWHRAEIPGPTKASVIIKPEVVLALLKRAERPILVVGHEAAKTDLGGKKPIDYAIRIARNANIPVVATAQTINEFIKRDFKPIAWMSAMDIGNRLSDPKWGISGDGKPHDLALFLGLPYHMGWVILSGLKHFALHLKTVSLDRFYQPH